MALIKLKDGRELSIVQPHLGDQMEVERQMRQTHKGYGAAQFRDDMKLVGFQTAVAVFATLRRAGERPTIHEILEIDLTELGVVAEPGDNPDEIEESEGEQSEDPQFAGTDESADPAQE